MISKSIIRNSVSLLLTRLVQSLSMFVMLAAVARTRGTFEFGQFALAMSWYLVFMTMCSQGMKVLFTRELAKYPNEVPACLRNGTVAQGIACIVAYLCLLLVLAVARYTPSTAFVCRVVGLTIFPFSLSNVTEAVLQAQERMHLIAAFAVPVYLARLAVAVLLLTNGYTIISTATILVISETLILLLEWTPFIATADFGTGIDWSYVKHCFSKARSLMAIEGIAVLRDRLQMLMLSFLGGEIVVGVYGGLIQLLQPFQILAFSAVIASFPSMSKASRDDAKGGLKLSNRMIGMLLTVAFPFVIGSWFFGSDILAFIYKQREFGATGHALPLLACTLIALSFTRPLSYLLVANGWEGVNLREVMVTTTIGIVAGCLLLPRYKVWGAVVVALIMEASACLQYLGAVTSRLGWPSPSVFVRPIVVSLCMLPFMIIAKRTALGIPFVVAALLGAFAIVSALVHYIHASLRLEYRFPFGARAHQ